MADQLALPYVYIRPKPKDHGMKNQIEGELPKGSKVVVIEDLISTGGSSLKAVKALRDAGYDVVGMVASFTYGFDIARNAFEAAGVELITLTDYESVVEKAVEIKYINSEDIEILNKWRKEPSKYSIK